MSIATDHVSDRLSAEPESINCEKPKFEEYEDISSGEKAGSTPVDTRTVFERKAALINALVFGASARARC